MGGIVDTLFGGSKNSSKSTQSSVSSSNSNSVSNSESGNKAYDYLMNSMSPNVSTGNSAFGQMGALLGVGGDKAAAEDGYNNFLKSSGYQNIFKQAMDGVTGSAAARGMLNSGATLKALQGRGADLAQQSFGNYLGNLQNLFTGGQQSAGLIGNAGAYSKSNSVSNSQSNSNSTGQSDASGYQKNGILNTIFG